MKWILWILSSWTTGKTDTHQTPSCFRSVCTIPVLEVKQQISSCLWGLYSLWGTSSDVKMKTGSQNSSLTRKEDLKDRTLNFVKDNCQHCIAQDSVSTAEPFCFLNIQVCSRNLTWRSAWPESYTPGVCAWSLTRTWPKAHPDAGSGWDLGLHIPAPPLWFSQYPFFCLGLWCQQSLLMKYHFGGMAMVARSMTWSSYTPPN